MAAAASTNQKAYHYTDKPIANWDAINSSSIKSRYTIGKAGKPIGFWYAYGTTWKNLVNSSKVTYKYAFNLPEDSFITISDKPDPSKILQLTTIDELKEFLELTGVGSFMKTPEEIKGEHNYEAATMGGNSDDEEEHNYEAAIIGNGDEERLPIVNWPEYWESISKLYGGIEFKGELIRPRSNKFIPKENIIEDEATGEQINISWLRKLDIPSGVIFDPKRFFGGEPPSALLQTGGKRRRTVRHRNRKQRRTVRR